MSETEHDEAELIRKPLTPAAGDGSVVVKDPPEAAMVLTPDAAEISGLRMIEAADKARRELP